MKTQKKLIISTLSIVLLFTSCSINQAHIEPIDAKIEQEMKLKAMKAIKTVAGSLQSTLNMKVKEGGLVNAATFCSTHASSLAKNVSKTLDEGVKLKRITDKPRNSSSQATEEQLEVFEEIKTKISNGEKIDMIVKQKSTDHYQVYKPIIISGKCLNCHGNDEKRNPEAYKIISKKYPNDKAINYKVDDFRGAFLVDIIK